MEFNPWLGIMPELLDLRVLAHGLPAITPNWGASLAECCAVCLENQNHPQGKALSVQGDYDNAYTLMWPPATEQMLRSWNDLTEATQFGATGIAVLLIEKEAGYTVVQRSRKGPGFDYWLGNHNDDIPFQNMARLEISGILNGTRNQIDSRVREKKNQIGEGELPGFTIIVEFGNPLAKVHNI